MVFNLLPFWNGKIFSQIILMACEKFSLVNMNYDFFFNKLVQNVIFIELQQFNWNALEQKQAKVFSTNA